MWRKSFKYRIHSIRMDKKLLFKKAVWVCFILSWILIPAFTYLTIYNYVGFNIGTYDNEFERNKVTIEDAHGKALKVIAFIRGESDVLDIGLNENERTHMQDVKDVMQTADTVYKVLLGLLLISVGFLLYGYWHEAKLLKQSLFISGLVLMIFPLLLFIIPFDILFDLFHQPFFDPGTWIFQPEDVLVSLFPNGFFYGMAFRIFGGGMIVGVVLLIVAYFLE